MDFLNALVATIDGAPDLDLLATACTRADGLSLLNNGAADVLIVDLGLPDGSGIDVIRAASIHWPACAVMVSTNFGDEAHVMGSIEAGASGYLLKHATPASLASEIRSIADGGSPISPLIARQMLTRFRDAIAVPFATVDATAAADAQSAPAILSRREKEVLEMITKGFTTDEIAKRMLVSSHTVATFIRRIYRKLNVNSKAQAIYTARVHGLL